MNLNKIKEFIMKNKIAFLIAGIVLLLVIILFAVVRCSNELAGKENVGELYYEPLDGVLETTTDSGTHSSIVDYNSVKYTLKGMIVNVVQYHNSNISGSIGKDDQFKDVTIQGVKYRYKEASFQGDYVLREYYTQVDTTDTYYISFVFKNTEENDKKIKKFINSLILNHK